jgi:sodium/proline symporter
LSGGLFDLYEIVPGFALSLLAIVITSMLTRAPEQEVLLDFDQVSSTFTQ